MTGSPIKIGIMLRHAKERGGIAVITSRIVELLLTPEAGLSCYLLFSEPDQRERFSHLGGEHVVLASRSKFLWDQVAVPRFAAREGLDVLYNPKLSVPLWSATPAAFAQASAEQFVAAWAFPWWDRVYTRAMMPRYCRRAAAVVTFTSRGREDIIEHMGGERSKIHVVAPGVQPWLRPASPDAQAELRNRYQLPRRYVLFVGGITPLKNMDNLVRAMALLPKAHDIHLVIAGFRRIGSQRHLVLAESLGLDGRVHEIGFVADRDLAALYSGAECLALPSWYEGFGIPVIEAMACGCPVVCSDAGSLPEVAAGAALLVDPAKPPSIAGAIGRLTSDPALRHRHIERGAVRAAEFSWSEAGKRMAAVLRQVAVEGRARRASEVVLSRQA